MAISEAFSGSETVSTTEHSLTTDTAGPDVETSDGVFQCLLDLSALAAGDEFEYSCMFKGAQASPNWVSPSLVLLHGWDMTLDKIAGTDRNIDWSIRKVA
jgi:hypothetical protein